VVVFRPLVTAEIEQVVKLAVGKIQVSLEPKGIALQVSPGAISRIAKENYNQQYGARQIQHYLKDTFESQIAELLLQEAAGRRDTIILGDDLQLRVEKAAAL
jgi:ATP-dependent Clp protease ATP-binding subunit ClpA